MERLSRSRSGRCWLDTKTSSLEWFRPHRKTPWWILVFGNMSYVLFWATVQYSSLPVNFNVFYDGMNTFSFNISLCWRFEVKIQKYAKDAPDKNTEYLTWKAFLFRFVVVLVTNILPRTWRISVCLWDGLALWDWPEPDGGLSPVPWFLDRDFNASLDLNWDERTIDWHSAWCCPSDEHSSYRLTHHAVKRQHSQYQTLLSDQVTRTRLWNKYLSCQG